METKNTLRPYPPSGLTTARWKQITPQTVKISNLIFTQTQVGIRQLLDIALHNVPSFTGDNIPNVVSYGGRMYLEDGHHRVTVDAIRGQEYVQARVYFIPQ